jgi:hypothetical protein
MQVTFKIIFSWFKSSLESESILSIYEHLNKAISDLNGCNMRLGSSNPNKRFRSLKYILMPI